MDSHTSFAPKHISEQIELTKETFHTALLQLMASMPLEEIKTTDIVKRSGMSRSAFYRHYHSKWDLLDEMREYHVANILRIVSDGKKLGDMRGVLTVVFRYLKSDPYRTKLGYKVFFNMNTYPERPYFLRRVHPPQSPVEDYHMAGFESALAAIAFQWISRDMQEAPEEMADICMELFCKCASLNWPIL